MDKHSKKLFTSLLFIAFYLSGCATDTKVFSESQKTDTIDSYSKYLEQYPSGTHRNEAKQAIERIIYNQYKNQNTIQALQEFIEKYPTNIYISNAKDKITQFKCDQFDNEIKKCDDNAINLMLSQGFSPNQSCNIQTTETNPNGTSGAAGQVVLSPLERALTGRCKNIAKVLIDKGANINWNEGRFTALDIASFINQIDMLELLVQSGANVNIGNPLFYAVRYNNINIFEYLLNLGASPLQIDLTDFFVYQTPDQRKRFFDALEKHDYLILTPPKGYSFLKMFVVGQESAACILQDMYSEAYNPRILLSGSCQTGENIALVKPKSERSEDVLLHNEYKKDGYLHQLKARLTAPVYEADILKSATVK